MNQPRQNRSARLRGFRRAAGAWALVLSGAAATVAACGGDSDGSGASCSTGRSCGGDPVGTWTIANQCDVQAGANDSIEDLCPGATADVSKVKASGTYSFGADGTYTSTTSADGPVSLTIPKTCLTAAQMQAGQTGLTLTCEALPALLQLLAAAGGTSGDTNNTAASSFKNLTCTDKGSACACSGTLAVKDQQQTGTYKVSGSMLTTTPASGADDATEWQYCAEGGKVLRLTQTSGSDAGASTVQPSLILTRK